MADSYVARIAGKFKLVMGLVTSAGAGDTGKIPALDASGRLSTTMMPVGVIADTISLPTTENLAAGDQVNIYDNAGTVSGRKADATTTGKPSDGFVLAATTSPAAALIYCDHGASITGLSGLTKGADYWLSAAAPGGVTPTPVTGAGKLDQYIGKAMSATELRYIPDRGVELNA